MNATEATYADEELIGALRRAVEARMPVPAAVDVFADEVFDMVAVTRHVAELVFDSRENEPAGVRSDAGSRDVTFRAPGVELEVTVLAHGRRQVVGQLIPPQSATLEMISRDERRSVPVDRLGRFVIEDVPVGPLSLRCVLDDDAATVVQTEWLVV